MKPDEQQIRALVATWMEATKSGDVETVLGLMADDVVFLRGGHPPMGKEEFARTARSQANGGPQFDGVSDIRELQIVGEWAFAWSQLRVKVTMPDGAQKQLAGPTLTIFRKIDAKWVLARDANMLAPVQS